VQITVIKDIVAISGLARSIALLAKLIDFVQKFVHLVHGVLHVVPRSSHISECSNRVGKEQLGDDRVLVDVVRISLEIMLVLPEERKNT
jgi:hypothetical protein